MNPNISVVLPVYNAESFLDETLRSILIQEGVDFEVLAIDDGSDDGSLDILHSYKDTRLRIIRNEVNRGLIYTLNKGIELSEAPYIARIDADDVCLPGRFFKQFEYLENHPHTFVVSSSCEYIDANGKTIRKNTKNMITDENIKYHLLFGNVVCHPAVMMRRSTFDRFRYNEDYYIAEDYGLWVNLISNGRSIHIIDEPLIKYRLHVDNISQKKISNKFESLRKIIKFQFDQYEIDYTSNELDIQTSFAARKLATNYMSNEIENWLKKLYGQIAGGAGNNQITREVFYYYYMQIFLSRYKNEPWKWLKLVFSPQSYMPQKFIDRFGIMRQVIAEKMNN